MIISLDLDLLITQAVMMITDKIKMAIESKYYACGYYYYAGFGSVLFQVNESSLLNR